jgi:hypothetical protein
MTLAHSFHMNGRSKESHLKIGDERSKSTRSAIRCFFALRSSSMIDHFPGFP